MKNKKVVKEFLLYREFPKKIIIKKCYKLPIDDEYSYGLIVNITDGNIIKNKYGVCN